MQKKKIDHSFAYYKCLEKVGQNIPRFLEAPFVRMRSASLKTERGRAWSVSKIYCLFLYAMSH